MLGRVSQRGSKQVLEQAADRKGGIPIPKGI